MKALIAEPNGPHACGQPLMHPGAMLLIWPTRPEEQEPSASPASSSSAANFPAFTCKACKAHIAAPSPDAAAQVSSSANALSIWASLIPTDSTAAPKPVAAKASASTAFKPILAR
eukprot:CAMPEP_0176136638 /NCGR_PEP_ID=MMETSP0120_2-20121206/69346_1 /TAXON_ID=160619 /ORGANISM="Kryptoperidinium foliaceum, Strain CCMP 1326" /LENGTH=114 /DNA_ID=CAMNT_0017472425 /DNA_START=165 /DNA_END=509 /DNA_ORIENTATION=+